MMLRDRWLPRTFSRKVAGSPVSLHRVGARRRRVGRRKSREPAAHYEKQFFSKNNHDA